MPSEKEFLAQIAANQGIIYKLVGLYADSDEDRKDLYQEILLQAWRAYGSFRGEAKFSTWLYRVSLNTILTSQRKRQLTDYREEIAETAAIE
ncbi:MAG: sigma-70 family RNA polymerase sigma factor, partial [Chitinophagaceae bacterium]|nr:sigma-70 family RNA polymerase sigma factor [Chitinophagaceae bacterium]